MVNYSELVILWSYENVGRGKWEFGQMVGYMWYLYVYDHRFHCGAIVLKNIFRKQNRIDAIPSGRDRSTTSSFLPNWVRSCPLGVAKKKEYGAQNTERRIFGSKVLKAFTPPPSS